MKDLSIPKTKIAAPAVVVSAVVAILIAASFGWGFALGASISDSSPTKQAGEPFQHSQPRMAHPYFERGA